MEESKTFWEIIKSRGFLAFVAMFIIMNGIITLVMDEFRDYWTLVGFEAMALLFYLISNGLKNRDGEAFFWKWFKNEKNEKA